MTIPPGARDKIRNIVLARERLPWISDQDANVNC